MSNFISDHALVRYLERHVGVDLDGLRSRLHAMVGPAGQQAFVTGGHVDAALPDGGTAVIRNGSLVTILEPGQAPKPTAAEYEARHGFVRTDERVYRRAGR